MQAGRFYFFRELRRALLSLFAYLALLAGMGYGGFALMNGAFVSVLAAEIQRLEWMTPKAGAGEYFHPSLPPKLRGTIEEQGSGGDRNAPTSQSH